MGLGSFVGNLTGGLIGESDAEKAAKDANSISKAASKKTLSELDTSWGEVYDWLKPYLDEGSTALDLYKQTIGAAPDQPVFDNFNFDYTKMQDNPAYQFVRDQGLQAVDRIMAKNRMLGSGNRLAAITDYASGLASTEYANEWQRQMEENKQNNNLLQQGFSNASDIWSQNTQNYNWLATLGSNTATNLAQLRTGYAGARSDAYANRASERTAASLIPTTEKQNFLNNIFKTVGNVYATK